MTPITVACLRKLGACESGIAAFVEAFPDGLIPAEDDAGIAAQAATIAAAGLDVEWAADNLLAPHARAEYELVRAHAWAEYERVRATAWAEYARVLDAARAEYERVWATAFAEYERIRALAFLRAYRGQA